MARSVASRSRSTRWLAGAMLAMGLCGLAHAQSATVTPKLLPASAFTTPTLELLAGCGVPDQAAIAIRVLSEIPGATDSNVPPPAPWCSRLLEATPADPTSSEVLQMDQTDFVSHDAGKTLQAVGADGDLGTLDTRAARADSNGSASKGFWSFLKRAPAPDATTTGAPGSTTDAGDALPPPSFSYVVTPDLLLLNRPGGLFAFDRHNRRFCPAGIALPGVASKRALYQISDGRVLVVTWSLPERDKAAVQTAVLVVPPSLCPPVANGSGS